MKLQGHAAHSDPAAAERLNGYVDTLDEVIGLASMRRRAERNGGTLQITTPASGGTQLTWTGRPRNSNPTSQA